VCWRVPRASMGPPVGHLHHALPPPPLGGAQEWGACPNKSGSPTPSSNSHNTCNHSIVQGVSAQQGAACGGLGPTPLLHLCTKGHQPAGAKAHARGPSNPVAPCTKGTPTQALLAIAHARPRLHPNQHAHKAPKPARHWGCTNTQSTPSHHPLINSFSTQLPQ